MPTLPIYNKCNNNCIMCTNPKNCRTMSDNYFSLPYITKRIERFYQGDREFLENYHDTFSVTGGEPTLRSEFINILKKIDSFSTGIKINLLTNGRMFFYESYAKEVLKLDINLELVVSIHGHTANIHDGITQIQDSFKQTISGIENIFRFKKPTHIVEIRVIVHRKNYQFLEKITKFVKDNFPIVNRLVFIFFEIEGQAIKNIKILKLSYTELSPYIDNIYDLIDYFSEVRFYHFPLCVLPEKFFPFIWRTLPDFEVSFTKQCDNCNLKDYCLGIHKGYLKYIGSSEFQAIKHDIDIEKGTNWHRPILKIRI